MCWGEGGAEPGQGPRTHPFSPFSLPLSLSPPYEQEAASSFAQWEALMRGRGSSQEGDPFAEVMTLVTHMYKQTAIAKVTQIELIVIVIVILLVTAQPSWWNLLSAQLRTGSNIKTQHVSYMQTETHSDKHKGHAHSLLLSRALVFISGQMR